VGIEKMASMESSERRERAPVRYAELEASRRVGRRRRGGAARYEGLASLLGWFGLGLGLAELAAPGRIARFVGVRDDAQNRRVLRAMGMREIASGVGILARPGQPGWAWSRVGGDVIDLAFLAAALAADGTRRDRVAAAAAAVAGVTMLDVLCSERLSRPRAAAPAPRTIRVAKAVTIGRPAEALYAFWRELENLPRVMRHLEAVEPLGERRSRWRAKAPFGRVVEWESEITEDRQNERIAWRSLPGADIESEGAVSFARAPGGRGTTVRVELRYEPPAGPLGAVVAKLFGQEPGQALDTDLRGFKAIMETGEILLSDATAKGWGAAQPATEGAMR
jgi:uncharacterized membrane protein